MEDLVQSKFTSVKFDCNAKLRRGIPLGPVIIIELSCSVYSILKSVVPPNLCKIKN